MSKQLSFACQRCKTSKRKCDSAKPTCSLCQRQNRECVYSETRPRKRKYWDEEYVRGLEAQVHSLLSILESQEGSRPASSPAQTPALHIHAPLHHAISGVSEDAVYAHDRCHSDNEGNTEGPSPNVSTNDRSIQAMEELCVMLWRTNVGDGVTIINDTVTGDQYSLEASQKNCLSTVVPSEPVLGYSQDQILMHELVSLFLTNINEEHQFTSYISGEFLVDFPNQSIEHAFLHSAIIAVGSTFSTRPNAAKIGDAFAEFAESLIFSCCRQMPSIKVIQGLSMCSWRSLALGRDHFGWIFISMAAGMCVHLRLHVLALGECDARRLEATEQEIRTFWMFYIIDRTAISILGRNCALPWRRVNVPSFDSTFTSATADLSQISFAAQCQMWYLNDQHMDQVFSSSFDVLPIPQQVRLLISSQEALSAFFRSRDHRLHLSGDISPKPVLLFHLAYQMTILITMPPFLRIFASLSQPNSKSSLGPTSDYMLLVLRSLTAAATATVRLVRMYKKSIGFEVPPNPVIIHHLLSAAIVHLMNATGHNGSLRSHSTYWVRHSLELLQALSVAWPNRAERSIKVIRVLAQRWGVTSALPLSFSYRVEPSHTGVDGESFPEPDPQWAELSSSFESAPDFSTLDWSTFDGLRTGADFNDSATQSHLDLLAAAGELCGGDSFTWLA